MRYIKVSWIHDNEEPILFYSEIGGDNYEVKKIEIYRDGNFGLATTEIEFGGSELGTAEVPSVAEIAEEPEFLPAEISKEEFEEVWEEYVGYMRKY